MTSTVRYSLLFVFQLVSVEVSGFVHVILVWVVELVVRVVVENLARDQIPNLVPFALAGSWIEQ